jgi:hypothetical protein
MADMQVEIDSAHRPLPTQRSSRCSAGSGEAAKSMMYLPWKALLVFGI